MITFNYFNEMGAFSRTEDGKYMVDFEKMKEATKGLGNLILKLQGDGNYEGAKLLVEQKGIVNQGLQAELDIIGKSGIPVDIVFEQGPEMLGL
jgi:hypothetical protein